jgi:hypothetical protein
VVPSAAYYATPNLLFKPQNKTGTMISKALYYQKFYAGAVPAADFFGPPSVVAGACP